MNFSNADTLSQHRYVYKTYNITADSGQINVNYVISNVKIASSSEEDKKASLETNLIVEQMTLGEE